MEKRYRVTLTETERADLRKLVSVGKAAAQKLVRARILLLADQAEGGSSKSDPEIVESLGCGRASVERIPQAVRGRRTGRGPESKAEPTGLRAQNGWQSGGPLDRFGMQRRAGRSFALDTSFAGRSDGSIGACGVSVVRDGSSGAKKNELKPWLKKGWCLSEGPSADFVAAMEDVLEVYHRPYDADRPVVCMDECSKQLIGEVREPLLPKPGHVAKQDSEYERRGTANVFMAVEPLAGQRTTQVTERRTRVDWARFVHILLLSVYPLAEKVVLVMDNLNTHGIASLYEAFAPEIARALAARLEIHYTPKHGSWLNMAETELSVLARQCLDRRIDDRDLMAREIAVWQTARNTAEARINWQFKTEDARIKLKRLYPSFEV